MIAVSFAVSLGAFPSYLKRQKALEARASSCVQLLPQEVPSSLGGNAIPQAATASGRNERGMDGGRQTGELSLRKLRNNAAARAYAAVSWFLLSFSRVATCTS